MNPFMNAYNHPAQSLISQKNYLMSQIQQIDSQLEKAAPQALTTVNNTEEIKKIVAAEVKQQLAAISQQSADVGILRAMGEVLSESDQLWLRDNLAGLPKFLASDDGRGIVELLLESYRKAIT